MFAGSSIDSGKRWSGRLTAGCDLEVHAPDSCQFKKSPNVSALISMIQSFTTTSDLDFAP